MDPTAYQAAHIPARRTTHKQKSRSVSAFLSKNLAVKTDRCCLPRHIAKVNAAQFDGNQSGRWCWPQATEASALASNRGCGTGTRQSIAIRFNNKLQWENANETGRQTTAIGPDL
jgi:hypothetical protein